ncbi:MAG TPA: metal-dependent hydrolase [Noviherbaspirillum sp.]|uniref:metal-dependent hydrolase n=1 Tax=Noviherbaspirillum sp. TaxID=1926288 RepID=UPI002D72F997|nr:metal-dependent hydrolase [Noviherbaspirillum sp.]HYD96804.1 metal-dependent hydrolase [Noviherbaspirillum sp.]
MTDLVVRRLLIDLEKPFDRHWWGGDAFRSALFNALSMSFPVGEQFFIDSVRMGYKALPEDKQERFRTEVQGFVGQEATHRRIHGLFNAHLDQQGLVNNWAPRVHKRLKLLQGVAPVHWVAITAANEHFTAILADWLLRNHDLLDDAEPRLKTMWLWHAAEESEHKSTAFDLFHALGGDRKWRLIWMRHVTMIFLGDAIRQTVSNLRREGMLWKWSTWKSGARFLFGKRGMVRESFKPWRAYFRKDFHPSQQESGLSARWLTENRMMYTLVGGA